MWNRQDVIARFFLMLGVVAYIAAFLFSYEQWVAPRYAGWGLSYREVPAGYILISWALCLISALWMPRDLTRPSQLLFYIQYFVIFIPASFILYHSGRPGFPPEEVLIIVFALFSGLTILQASYKLPLLDIKRDGLSARVFWRIFWCVAAGLVVYLLSVFGSHFQLADFKGIYDVRRTSSELVASSGGAFAGYAQTWLSGFILPFLFSVGVFRKRWGFVVTAAAGYLYLLGVGGSKSTMLAIVYLSAIYFLVRSGGKNAGVKIAICFAGLLLFPAVLTLTGSAGGAIDTWYVAIIHSRIFNIPALSIGQYYSFFENHPLTYGSHISGVNQFLTYPYDMDIPRTIGKYFYHAELTANVNMWAQDGIASFGLIGIPVVSVIAAVLFWSFDSIASRHDSRFVTVALGNIALSFANISLFTTIISGGLFLLIVALYFYRKE
ncbi:MAG: hypothetical protein WC216_00120 [Gallionella sp.]|jgi:hypothetical protein